VIVRLQLEGRAPGRGLQIENVAFRRVTKAEEGDRQCYLHAFGARQRCFEHLSARRFCCVANSQYPALLPTPFDFRLGQKLAIAREDVRMVGAIETDRPRRMIRAAHEFKRPANAVVPCLGGKTGQGNERLDVFGLGNDEIPDHQDRRQRKCGYRRGCDCAHHYCGLCR